MTVRHGIPAGKGHCNALGADMDEIAIIITILLLILLFMLSGCIFGIIALVKISGLRKVIRRLELRQRMSAGPQADLPAPAPPPAERAAPPRAPPPLPPTVPVPTGPAEPTEPSVLTTAWRDFEKRLGQRWMTWVGALVILVGMGFFVRQALTWAGPIGRVAIGVVVAIVLLVAGDRFSRRGWRALGQGLMGAGLGVFYVSMFYAFSRELMPQGAAFAAMVLGTAAGMTLAILHDAMALAVIAVLGGFFTPVMLSTGTDARDRLFAYIMVLNLGVFGVAFFRKWLALDVLAFVGTVALYIGWYDSFYEPAAMVPALLWLGGFYVVFLVLPFVYHLRRGEATPWPRFVMALANAAFGFSMAYVILKAEHLHVAGFVALGMTACYVAMGTLSRRRVAGDVRQTLGFLALAVAFLVLAAPLHFKADGIILAWTIDAPVLLFLGYRYRYRPLRVMAFLVLVLVAFYGLGGAWPTHTALFLPIFNRRFLTAIAPALSAAVFALLHLRDRKLSDAIDGHLRTLAACGAGVLALVLVHAEFAQWFGRKGAEGLWKHAAYYAHCFYVFLWTAGAGVYTFLGIRLKSLKTRITGLAVLAVSFAMVAMLLSDPPAGRYVLFLNVRFIAMLVNAAVCFGMALLYHRLGEPTSVERRLAYALAVIGAVVLLVVLSVESHNFSSRLLKDPGDSRRLALMSVSVVWGLYAFVLLALGIVRRHSAVRYAALGLFGLTVLKLVVLDTSKLQDVYRWITYLVIGCLLIAGSYLYYRLEQYIGASSKEDSE